MKMQHRIDFIVGLFVIAGLIAFAVLAFKVSGLTSMAEEDVYHVTAEFTNVGDLKIRAPVAVGGVTIGRVTDITLDPATFKAVVSIEIEKKFNNIPIDSTANIFTAGLLGANYISLTPGFEEEPLKEGSRIENTNQALILQNLIGEFMFNMKKDAKKA